MEVLPVSVAIIVAKMAEATEELELYNQSLGIDTVAELCGGVSLK